MKFEQMTSVLLWGLIISFGTAPLAAQNPAPAKPTEGEPQAQARTETPTPSETPSATAAKDSPRAQAYYFFTMGHIYEQQYEATSRAEYATEAIDAYKKAYALDPKSQVIGERLAEMYWKAQRIHDAVTEAEEVLTRDPNDVQSRRLLGRIYLRSIGDVSANNGQPEMVSKAIQQFSEIYRLDPGDTESALWLARLYRLRNEHEKAEKVLRGILKSDPDNDPAVEQLTQLLMDEGKSDEAIALLEGITAHSSSAVLLDLLGDAYGQTRDLKKAEKAYRKAVELDPSELGHQRGLAQTLMAEEKFEEALTAYQKLADLMPDDADVYLRLAQIYRELHQLDKAEESLMHARQYAPGNENVLYNEAMLYKAQGRFEDALRVLSEAVAKIKSQAAGMPSRQSSLAILYQQLGQLYRETHNYQAAIYTYQEMGHLGEEEDRRARMMTMETYREAKDIAKALQAGKEALAKYPADASLAASQALLLGEDGKTDDAVKMLKAHLTGSASDRETYLNLAQVYERGRKYKEAEEAAKAAEAIPGQGREKEMAWFLLGAIYERQKFFDKAEEQFKKVLAVSPDNGAALNYYGYMLADLGIRLEEAETMVNRALKDEPYNGAYLDSLGWIYFKENKMADAEATLRKAVERETHDPTIRAHLGDVLAKTGRVAMAAAEWEKSLNEWHRALPADVEEEKVADLEKKLGQSRHRVAQKSTITEAKP